MNKIKAYNFDCGNKMNCVKVLKTFKQFISKATMKAELDRLANIYLHNPKWIVTGNKVGGYYRDEFGRRLEAA